jgi:transcription termination factor Rho
VRKGANNMIFEEMSLAQLKQYAKDQGVKGVSALKKSDLIERLKEEQKAQKMKEEKAEESTKETKETKEKNKNFEEKKNQKLADLDSGEKADGILEVMQDGYGFIRCENYLPGENDVYVSPSQIRRFNLKTGDILRGSIRVKTQGEKFSALLYIDSINGYPPYEAQRRKNFEDLTPIFPNERISLET